MSTEQREQDGPEVVADILCLATGVMIPAGVIATWTPREREAAAAWAAAEHLHASDNPVRRLPQPGFVLDAALACASVASAQLAVEGWAHYLTGLEERQGDVSHDQAVRAARRAIAGLVTLLERGRR